MSSTKKSGLTTAELAGLRELLVTPDLQKLYGEGPMKYKMGGMTAKPGVLARVVHWRSKNGKWVVVAGPFPEMYRSETRDTPEKAAKCLVDDMYNRKATTRDDQYAKVLAKDVMEIQSGENEWGTVTP